MNNGTITRAFLDTTDAKTRAAVLSNIADHYGMTKAEALEEVTDPEAESLLDYVTGPMRPAVHALLKRRRLIA